MSKSDHFTSRRRVVIGTAMALVTPASSAGLKDIFGGKEKKAAELSRAAENGSTTALETLKKEANEGNRYAALQFGYLHHTGKLASGKNIPLAMKAYKIAVGNVGNSDEITGNALAAYNMGLIYLWGQHNGGKPEPQEAMRWLLAAAGDEASPMLPAVMRVALIYEKGMAPIPINPTESMRWYRIAASMREPIAQFKLGRALVEGMGVAKDPMLGMLMLRYAADKWNRSAMYYLAQVYANGSEFQEPILYDAAKWLYIASTNDERYKKASSAMLETLSPADQQRVIRAAKLWISGHLKLPPRIEYNAPLNAEPPVLPGTS